MFKQKIRTNINQSFLNNQITHTYTHTATYLDVIGFPREQGYTKSSLHLFSNYTLIYVTLARNYKDQA